MFFKLTKLTGFKASVEGAVRTVLRGLQGLLLIGLSLGLSVSVAQGSPERSGDLYVTAEAGSARDAAYLNTAAHTAPADLGQDNAVSRDETQSQLLSATTTSSPSSSSSSSLSACLDEYAKLQQAYFNARGQLTVVSSDGNSMEPFMLLRSMAGGNSYSFWEHLNGEIRGYALRNGKGFDFNQGQRAVDELNWHPTLIWDRLLDKDTSLKDYVCVFTGRARLAGHKVSLLRLAPQDGMRYGYLIAKDDESSLPVEIAILEPQGGIAGRLLVVDTKLQPDLEFPIDDATFDRFEQAPVRKPDNSATPWPELTLPRAFELIDAGFVQVGAERHDFQEFSDGLNSFRVYKAARTSVLYPALNNGTISILRKNAANSEYAVVGEVPLRLAELVLSKINAVR